MKDQARLFKQHIKEALEEASKEQEMFSFDWGCGPGDLRKMPPGKRFKLAERVMHNSKLQEIARMAGRLQNMAVQKQKTKTNQAPSEVVDIEMGNDLSRVLPSELALLRNKGSRREFLRKFAEGKLLQYKLEGREKEGQGPIIACLDSSGSMSVCHREEWSKAVALALFIIARKQKRAFACIHFGSYDEIKTFEFANPGKANPADVAEMASWFYAGGTNFERPLKEAVELLKQSEFNKADIIFITDGRAVVSNEFLGEFVKIKEEKEFSVYSIVLAGSTGWVEPFSDKVVAATPTEDGAALDMVMQI